MSTEWKRRLQSSVPSELSLFSLIWHRVVLDEGIFLYWPGLALVLTMLAHVIQNRATSIAKAVGALHSRCRWAASGTPIQNKLTDLGSLFQFLRVYPYCVPKTFDSEILKPLLQSDPQGFLRLKALVNYVTLCRDKTVLSLPNRVNEIHRLDFSVAEKSIYDLAKARTDRLFDNAIALDYTKRGTYLNALQWLNALRLICNHGTMHSKRERHPCAVEGLKVPQAWNTMTAQKAFESMLNAGAAICAGCSVDLADNACEDFRLKTLDLPQPRLSECLFLHCGPCVSRCTEDGTRSSACSHDPGCLTFDVFLTGSKETLVSCMKLPFMSSGEVPTKIKALSQSLRSCKIGEKRCTTLLLFHPWDPNLLDVALFFLIGLIPSI